jgi:hypothetical protein
MDKFRHSKQIKNYLPSLYDTRYSRVLSFYGVQVNLNKLKSNILIDNELRQIFVNESPHFRCAVECLNNDGKTNQILHIDRASIVDYVLTNSLVHVSQYIDYIEEAHPETDAINSFVNFLHLMQILARTEEKCYSKICVLVSHRVDHNGKNFWLLIDGLHRSSILLALNKLMVSARVKFP